VVIFTRRDWGKLPDLDYEFPGHQWVEGSVEGHVYRSTPAMSAKRMERIFRHGDVAYAVECLITTKRDSDGREQYHPEIRALLSQYEPVFGPIPPGRPPDRGFEHTIELEVGQHQ
jgi:hypothetical protein